MTVGIPNQDEPDVGLSVNQVKSYVESILRRHSIKVLSESEWSKNPQDYYLYVRFIVNTVDEEQEGIRSSGGVRVLLVHKALASHNREQVYAPIWERGLSFRRRLSEELWTYLEPRIGRVLQQFSKDYLRANP